MERAFPFFLLRYFQFAFPSLPLPSGFVWFVFIAAKRRDRSRFF
jgi:hypothetical protein